MKSNYYLKLFSGAIIIFILYFFSGLIIENEVKINSEEILYGLLSNLLIVILVGYYISNSNLRGIKLTFSVFVIYYIIGCFNILIEAYIFNVTDRVDTLKGMLQGLFVSLFFAPIFVYLLNKWKGESLKLTFVKRTFFSWIWRAVLAIFLYLLFYLIAGMILQTTYPALMDFYKDKLPQVDVMILTQFPRGFLFVLIAVLMLRSLKLPVVKKALLVGLTFSIIGGVALLIPPNEFMPFNIRVVHGFEVGISNFLYGFIISYLLKQKDTLSNNLKA